MNVYIWKRREIMTGNYHQAGGAVAVAPTLERARELLEGYGVKEGESHTTEPDIIYPVPDTAIEYGEVFPDAGCC